MSVHVIQHPLLNHLLTKLRKKETEPVEFRALMKTLGRFMAYEVIRNEPNHFISIETPLEKMEAPILTFSPIVVSILRAGNGLLDGVLETLPNAGVGHIGIYRDKNLAATIEYYFRLPEKCEGKNILLLDPLLATGSTVIAAISRLKQYRVGKIKLMTILAAPEGLEVLKNAHPDVDLFTLSIERQLNEYGYILPGLGDAGDRLYNTH
jgi:uracil phosphoribosyltransferase